MLSFFTGTTRVPGSTKVVTAMLIACSCVNAISIGYDAAMMNALNILPSYTDYFKLTTTTLALQSAALWIGLTVGSLVYGQVSNIIGRKAAMFWAAVGAICAVVIQAAAQDIAMFVVARTLVGLFIGGASVVGPIYLGETLAQTSRGWGMGLFYDFFNVGGLISAGITYGTSGMSSTWAWRLPSALQALFSIICLVLLPWLPESPRWLVYQDRAEEALVATAQTVSNGDTSDPRTILQHKEILDTIAFEKTSAQSITWKQLAKTPSARRRVMLAISVGVITIMSGTNIVSYYLGTMLSNAGITSTTTQLQINIYMTLFTLVCSILGTWTVDHIGRKPLALISMGMCTLAFFLVGAFTKLYSDGENKPGVYATVAMIFLFVGGSGFGMTPLTSLYPVEVLNFSVRANGFALYSAVQNGLGLMIVFVAPIALASLGYITYLMNAGFNCLEILFIIFFWVETKGKTLEEIDIIFDGEVHSDVPEIRGTLCKADPEKMVNLMVEHMER